MEQTQTTEIFHQPMEASMQLTALKKASPEKIFEVYPVTRWDFIWHKPADVLGFQVAEIKRVGWWKTPKADTATVADTSIPKSKTEARIELVTLSLPFYQETPKFIGGVVNNNPAWFGKGTLTSLLIEGDTIKITLSRKAVEKRGFEQFISA